MIEISEIDKKVYDEFLENYQYQHFLQTRAMGSRRSLEGWESKLLGFFENNKLVGAMQINGIRLFLNKKKYEIPMGPLLNYKNKKQTLAALKALTKYMDKLKAIECEINPNLAVKVHYPHVKIIFDKTELIQPLKGLGFQYLDNTDQLISKLRWFFKKDISQYNNSEALLQSYDRETRRLIANAKSFPLEIVELNKNNLWRAVDILDKTAERRGFSSRNLKYHQSLFEYLNQDHEAKYLVVRLNVAAYICVLQEEIQSLEMDIEADEDKKSKRARNRVKQNKDQLLARKRRLKQLKKLEEGYVDISSGVFIGANKTMTYLFGGSKKEFTAYYGSYFLQDYSIHYALNHGYEIYDFYGTRSKISGFPEEEGVFDFKKGFGGMLYENIGYFQYRPKGLFNSIIQGLRKIKHLIKI